MGGRKGSERSVFGLAPVECEESSESRRRRRVRRRRRSECWPFINKERIYQRVRKKVSEEESDRKR